MGGGRVLLFPLPLSLFPAVRLRGSASDKPDANFARAAPLFKLQVRGRAVLATRLLTYMHQVVCLALVLLPPPLKQADHTSAGQSETQQSHGARLGRGPRGLAGHPQERVRVDSLAQVPLVGRAMADVLEGN